MISIGAIGDNRYRARVELAGSTEPPLALRAALANALPGLRVVPAQDTTASDIDCEKGEVEMLMRCGLPVGSSRVPGFRVGPPSRLPAILTASAAGGSGTGLRIRSATTEAGSPVAVRLGDEELLRRVHVVGATGTGKSTLLASMVHQLGHQRHGALVLDPHGTLVDRILEELPAQAHDRCMVVRSDDLEHPIPLSPLAAHGEGGGIETAIADIGEMFYQLYDPTQAGIVGPRFEDRIAHALRGLATLRGARASLLDVPMMLGNSRLQDELEAKLTDPRERMWWRNESQNKNSRDYGDLVSRCNSKFERFGASPALRAILGSGHDVYDPIGAMDHGRIILVDLAKGQIGSTTSRLLGYLLLNRFWVAAMNRSRPGRRFHVIVDEAHSVMAGSLVNMLSEGRKFGISVTVAHQYLVQLNDQVAAALSGNIGTSVVFRANGPHVRAHIAATGDQVSAATLSNLPTFHAVVTRNAAVGVSARPHTMVVDPSQPTCASADSDAVRARSQSLTAGLDLAELIAPWRPSSGSEPTTARPAARPQSSFLDEWLAKRAEATGGQSEAAAATPDAGAADDVEVA